MTLPAPNPTPAIATALAKIGLALKTQGQRSADELGLSPLQAQALSILHGHHEPLRGSELADELAVKRATTSVAVRTLVEKGLVNRRADAEDGRATRLSLTAKGTRIASSLDAWPELIREGVHDLNAQERAAFFAVFPFVRANSTVAVEVFCYSFRTYGNCLVHLGWYVKCV